MFEGGCREGDDYGASGASPGVTWARSPCRVLSFRNAYRPLVRDVIFAGWNPDEAEDAVSAAMIEVLQRWDSIGNPRRMPAGRLSAP